MYTNDPFDIPTPRDATPQKPDFRSEFWAQVPDMRPTYKRTAPATNNTCRFMPAEKRVYHVRGGCPHFGPDEQP